GQEMLVLVLVLVVLQFEEGENVVLPCNSPSSSYPCSIVNWLYSRDTSTTHTEVKNGKVVQSSPRASRLNMDSSCSLTINNITADDAGRYICRPGSVSDASVDENILKKLFISYTFCSLRLYIRVLTFENLNKVLKL
uniref:Ig-like domain-containing protein n=1 Tax=Poecilia latipinna TaxID=48699 RepID=A0A3B3THA2_9TELE